MRRGRLDVTTLLPSAPTPDRLDGNGTCPMILPNPQSEAARPEPGEDVLRTFNEWLAKDRSLGQNYIPPQAPQSEKQDKPDGQFKPRPSVIRRAFRTLAFEVVAVIIAFSGIIWQSQIRDMGNGARSLHASITAPPTGSSPSVSTSPNQTILDSSANAATQNATPRQATPSLSGARQVSEEHGAMRKQIEDLTAKVDAIHNIVDQLATNQEQLEQAIAAIRADEDSVTQKLLSETSNPSAVHTTPHSKTLGVHSPTRPAPAGHSVGPPLPLH